MKIKIINDLETALQGNFSKKSIWLETDLSCPICKKEGLVVKIRNNNKLGFFHQSSGIILACENWGKCESSWNKIGNGRDFPWHTWLSSYHRILDKDRGSFGLNFLKLLEKENNFLFNALCSIDYTIMYNIDMFNRGVEYDGEGREVEVKKQDG